jgi:hypothetical protein
MVREIVAVLLIGALTSSVSAAGLADGGTREGDKSMAEQPSTDGNGISKEMVVGTAMVVGGFIVGLYGFGNPTAPPPDPTQPSIFPHRTGVGLAGIGIAVTGGVLAWHAWHRSTNYSVQVGPHRLSVEHRIKF